MRVISGLCRGRKLVPIQGRDVRPTSDRTKEAVFNILGQKVKHAKVLDLFAGTGALGIETLSRGAQQAVFIDISCDTIKKNIALCGLEEKALVLAADLTNSDYLSYLPDQSFDLIFIDPPYGKALIELVLDNKNFHKLLHSQTIIIAEHAVKEKIYLKTPGLDIYRQKKYSKTMISLIRKL